MVAVLAVVQLGLTAAPPPVGTMELGVSLLVLFITVAVAGARIERRRAR